MFIYDDFSPSMKRVARVLGMFLFIGLVLGAFAFAFFYFVGAWKTATGSETPRQIVVTGEGKVAVKPDIATFTASVVTQAEKVGEAQSENTRRSNEVLSFLKKSGVEEKDLKTVGYFISPQYQYDSRPCIQIYPSPCPQNPPKIVSYEVRHSIEVKVRDLNKVDDLLAGAVDKGANEVGSVQFTVDKIEKVLAEARQKAIEDAKEKAEVLAKDLGVRLTRIVAFSEGGGPIFPRFEALGKGGDVGFGGGAAPAPQVAPGEQEIQSFVNVVYEFR